MFNLLERFHRAWGRRGEERGAGLVEISVSTGVLSIAVIGLAGTMTLGLAQIGASKQRSVAAAYAAEQIEQVRELPFEQVALYVQPTYSADPEHPDNDLSADGTTYEVEDGSSETLIVDTSAGAVPHVEDPLQRDNTILSAYQYVTWVDDPAIAGTEDYKRLTVVVTISSPQNRGITNRATFSSFIGEGGVVVPEVTPNPSPSSSPSPTATPVPTPAPSCEGDTIAPTGSMAILSGSGAETGYTSSLTVQVELGTSDACADVTAQLSNDGSTFTSAANMTPGIPETVTWTITSGDGTKTVHARFVDGAGNTSITYTDTIILDQALPSTPTGFGEVSCSMPGSDRTVTLTWNASTDTNLVGYRLYRSINDDPYDVVETTSTVSADDTSKKNHNSIRYLVRSYDRAGNESGDSDVITYPKNSC